MTFSALPSPPVAQGFLSCATFAMPPPVATLVAVGFHVPPWIAMALGGASSLPADAVTCGGVMGIAPSKGCDLTGEETRLW